MSMDTVFIATISEPIYPGETEQKSTSYVFKSQELADAQIDRWKKNVGRYRPRLMYTTSLQLVLSETVGFTTDRR